MKLKRGKPLEEMVKGSLNYTLAAIRRAFYSAFPDANGEWFYVVETFADHLIVTSNQLKVDEFYKVDYTTAENYQYTFTPRDQWETVELAYQPQTTNESLTSLLESRGRVGRKNATRFTETFTAAVELVESEGDETPNTDGPWLIRGIGSTANAINSNRRRYDETVLRPAIVHIQKTLADSASQGRIILSGEIDHPTDKGNHRELLGETVINWHSIQLENGSVMLEGYLLPTSRGRDLHVMLDNGVKPDLSQRAYGEGVIRKDDDGRPYEDVTWLVLTGYDFVRKGADVNAQTTFSESEDHAMNLRKQLLQIIAANPTLFNDSLAQQVRDATDEQLAGLQETIRAQMQIDPTADFIGALSESIAARGELVELRYQQLVGRVIQESTADLPYPDDIQTAFTTAVTTMLEAQPVGTAETELRAMVEARRTDFDSVVSHYRVEGQGGNGDGRMTGVAPVFEKETGLPDYAYAAFMVGKRLMESSTAGDIRTFEHDWKKPESRGMLFAQKYLEAYDAANMEQLKAESDQLRAMEEAETVSDLNLPTSTNRAVIMEVVPELVAVSVFDFDFVATSPTYIYYEAYAAESGAQPAIANEAATSDEGAWIQLAQERLEPGTVVVTGTGATPVYDEEDDYLIDYANGRLFTLAAGTIGDATTLEVDYTYNAVRGGEMVGIQRGKGTLSRQTVELKADRLAQQISREAVVFAASQMGYDVTTKTLGMLIREIREMIDTGIFRLALAQSIISGQSGGTWTASGKDYGDLVEKIGVAAVAMINALYRPTAIAMSHTNADRLSNWDGFKRDGYPNALMTSAGFQNMRVKNLPIYGTTVLPDTRIIIAHNELVQYRVLSSSPMTISNPLASYDTNGNVIAANQHYIEEFNTTVSLIAAKGSNVKVA